MDCAIERDSQEQNQPEQSASLEVGYYAASLSVDQDDAMGALIRDHWSAIENGTHYRGDVTTRLPAQNQMNQPWLLAGDGEKALDLTRTNRKDIPINTRGVFHH